MLLSLTVRAVSLPAISKLFVKKFAKDKRQFWKAWIPKLVG